MPRGEQHSKTIARGENQKEDEEAAATTEDKEAGRPTDDEAITGDTPGGPDAKAQKRKKEPRRKTRQYKKEIENKERQRQDERDSRKTGIEERKSTTDRRQTKPPKVARKERSRGHTGDPDIARGPERKKGKQQGSKRKHEGDHREPPNTRS